MRKYNIDRIANKAIKKLGESLKSKRMVSENYHSLFWKELLEPFFDECRIHVNDRKSLGNAVIQKIKESLKETSLQREKTEIKINMKNIEAGAKKVIPEEIGDVSGEDLFKFTEGECGPKPRLSNGSRFR